MEYHVERTKKLDPARMEVCVDFHEKIKVNGRHDCSAKLKFEKGDFTASVFQICHYSKITLMTAISKIVIFYTKCLHDDILLSLKP